MVSLNMSKKIKVKIEYNRKDCIGAAACTLAAPKYWKLADDNKADLIGGKLNKATGKYELEAEVSEEDYRKLEESALSCPVQVIKAEKS